MDEVARAYAEERGQAPLAPAEAARLESLVAAALAAHPDLAVTPLALALALARLPRALEDVPAEDAAELVLALACGTGNTRALTKLERAYFPAIDEALRAMRLSDDERAEVAQEVRRKLLVADGGAPPIVGYAGRGTLRGLLKVTATRTAISLRRKGGRERTAEEHEHERAASETPELDWLKQQYRAAFREAFALAVGALDAHERNLLRLHLLDRVTLEALAAMYGVHRATIVRQLAAARAKVERETGKALRARLDVAAADVEGVIDLVRSHFDASVERLFRPE